MANFDMDWNNRNRRATSSIMQLIDDDSNVNKFTPPSTSSTDELERFGYSRGISFDHNRRLINEIVENIFVEKSGVYDVSSSHCSTVENISSEYSFDKRLKYWRSVIDERKRLARELRKKTGKTPAEILFNRTTTVDDRDKQTVKRLLDYAERMNPLVLKERREQENELHEYIVKDPCSCTYKLIQKVEETLPRAERDGRTIVEISGMPAVTKCEQLGRSKEQGVESKSHWLRSRQLERRIEEKREDLERVIEYYPDIENLQIVGENVHTTNLIRHNSDIELMGEEVMDISTDTNDDLRDCRTSLEADEEEEVVEYGIQVNEETFTCTSKRSNQISETCTKFVCKPFEKVTKRVLHLKNIGQKILNCDWAQRPFYEKNMQLLKAYDEEFIFDKKPFRLISGEERDIIVQFRPRAVNIIKEKWILKVDPQIFCRKVDAIAVRFNGNCQPPADYMEKIDNMMRMVIEKSNFKMMRTLTQNLGSITPLSKPHEVICPYKRIMDERELFEYYNLGYKCERFHDLELLKELHKRIKKPREHAWDLKLESLKEIVLRVEGADKRALLFNEFIGILEEMKGIPVDIEEKIVHNPERDHNRFVYVRGIICTGIDEWEELTLNVEEAFLVPAIKEYYLEMAAEEEQAAEAAAAEAAAAEAAAAESAADGEETDEIQIIERTEEEVHEYVVKKVRRRKAFRDSLYVHTYTHLCNFVEDIVSVIESTEII